MAELDVSQAHHYYCCGACVVCGFQRPQSEFNRLNRLEVILECTRQAAGIRKLKMA